MDGRAAACSCTPWAKDAVTANIANLLADAALVSASAARCKNGATVDFAQASSGPVTFELHGGTILNSALKRSVGSAIWHAFWDYLNSRLESVVFGKTTLGINNREARLQTQCRVSFQGGASRSE